MAKSRAQRKAEQRRRQKLGIAPPTESDADAQHHTQVPETADVIEAELAERGADLDELRGDGSEQVAAPDDAVGTTSPSTSRRSARRDERERRQRAKESEARRKPKTEPTERKRRGRVMGFLVSCWAELKRVQWPDRETLIQASMVTILFIAVAAAYLGALDAIFSFLVDKIL